MSVQAAIWAATWGTYQTAIWFLTDVLHFTKVPVFYFLFFGIVILLGKVMARPVAWYVREGWDRSQRIRVVIAVTTAAVIVGELFFLVVLVSITAGKLAILEAVLGFPEIVSSYGLVYALLKALLYAITIAMSRDQAGV